MYKFVELFTAMVGVPALESMLINVLKQFNLIKDGQAQAVNKYLNVATYVLLYAVYALEVDVTVAEVDAVAKTVADFGFAALGLIPLGVKVTEAVHKALRGIPLLGFSHTLEKKAGK
jgi:hypothetical protein